MRAACRWLVGTPLKYLALALDADCTCHIAAMFLMELHLLNNKHCTGHYMVKCFMRAACRKDLQAYRHSRSYGYAVMMPLKRTFTSLSPQQVLICRGDA